MFVRVKPEEDVRAKKAGEWIQMIQEQMRKRVDEPPVPFSQLMQDIMESVKSDKFD